jgi:hypothetical protein
MTAALKAASRNLQLDPGHHTRMAAFSAFCWQHILERETPRWVAEARDGTIRLQQRMWAADSEQSCIVFHEAVDRMAYDFVLAYAKLLWPTGKDGREHLASSRRLGSNMMPIYATPTNLVVSRKKEEEMLDCKVATNIRTSTVESMIGCRVRSYLTALLLSDEVVPASQPMSVSKLLQRFLHVGQLPAYSNKKRDFTSISHHADNESLAPISDGREPSPAHKRRRGVSDVDTTTSRTSQERSSVYVRLRFTHSGTQRLQRMLFCPSRPISIRPKGTRATGELTEFTSFPSSNEDLHPEQRSPPAGKYRCWLQSCSQAFQATEDVIDHIQHQHVSEHGRLMKAALSFMTASFDVKPDETKRSMAGLADQKAL